ncbi:MAG: DUF4837 family protein [Flavobacteriales bacterium]|nr:DUF4837 family protein [Flavobacteriales bacterium]
MIRRTLTLLTAIVALVSFTQCESIRPSSASTGLHVTGNVGEIMVVCEQGIWDSEIKHYLDSGLTQFIMPYMPDVATFELVHRKPNRFEGSFKRYRNTLFVTIDPTYKGDKGKIELRKNVWAHSQMVIDIIAKDYPQMLETVKHGIGQVHDKFDKAEWKRIMERYQEQPDLVIGSRLEENFGINMALPNGSKLVTNRPNFYRIEFPKTFRPIDFGDSGQDAGGIHSGLLVYQYDFIDSNQLSLERLLAARDTMLKHNVPSEIEGMYMGTQYVSYVYPEGNNISTADGKVKGYEMRGMYVFLGNGKAGTGGAFWAFHFVNPETKKLVCVSGYVDAPPTTSWTQPLREIQAVLRSIVIV